MRFSDYAYVEDYLEHGKYPKIHDGIFALDRFIPRCNVLDLGCCTGLLSLRLADVHPLVVGVEPSTTYISKAPEKGNVRYVVMGISSETLVSFGELISENRIEAVFARRVLPEISECGGVELVTSLAETMRGAGVKYLAIEGRKPRGNAVNRLSSIDDEILAVNRQYKIIRRCGDCVLMEAR